jgi:hypothetical protein
MQPSKLVSNKERVKDFVLLSYSAIYSQCLKLAEEEKIPVLEKYMCDLVFEERNLAF